MRAGFYAFALDADKDSQTVASNPGHCLRAGIARRNGRSVLCHGDAARHVERVGHSDPVIQHPLSTLFVPERLRMAPRQRLIALGFRAMASRRKLHC